MLRLRGKEREMVIEKESILFPTSTVVGLSTKAAFQLGRERGNGKGEKEVRMREMKEGRRVEEVEVERKDPKAPIHDIDRPANVIPTLTNFPHLSNSGSVEEKQGAQRLPDPPLPPLYKRSSPRLKGEGAVG